MSGPIRHLGSVGGGNQLTADQLAAFPSGASASDKLIKNSEYVAALSTKADKELVSLFEPMTAKDTPSPLVCRPYCPQLGGWVEDGGAHPAWTCLDALTKSSGYVGWQSANYVQSAKPQGFALDLGSAKVGKAYNLQNGWASGNSVVDWQILGTNAPDWNTQSLSGWDVLDSVSGDTILDPYLWKFEGNGKVISGTYRYWMFLCSLTNAGIDPGDYALLCEFTLLGYT